MREMRSCALFIRRYAHRRKKRKLSFLFFDGDKGNGDKDDIVDNDDVVIAIIEMII